jgi:hypothetical protein
LPERRFLIVGTCTCEAFPERKGNKSLEMTTSSTSSCRISCQRSSTCGYLSILYSSPPSTRFVCKPDNFFFLMYFWLWSKPNCSPDFTKACTPSISLKTSQMKSNCRLFHWHLKSTGEL